MCCLSVARKMHGVARYAECFGEPSCPMFLLTVIMVGHQVDDAVVEDNVSEGRIRYVFLSLVMLVENLLEEVNMCFRNAMFHDVQLLFDVLEVGKFVI